MREGGRWRAGVLCLAVAPCLLADRTDAAPAPPAPARPAPPAAAVPAPAGAPRFEDLRVRGRKAYRAQRFEEARDLWADAYSLRLDDAETAADLALAYQHTDQKDQAIATNRDAIRLSSSGKLGSDKARRIRRAAYYNLGKLGAKRELRIGYDDNPRDNDGPSTCLRVASEPGCAQPVFACGRVGATGGAFSRFDYTMARFAVRREAARIVEDGQLIPAFESWVEFGFDADATHDRADAASYDVTLDVSSESRKPIPGEADGVYATENSGCDVVHVDACARRLGLYCAWGAWTVTPLAAELAQAVARGLATKGFRVLIVDAAPGLPNPAIMQALFYARTDRSLFIHFADWQSDTLSNTGFRYHVVAEVRDGEGRPLAVSQAVGNDNLGGSLFESSGHLEEAVPAAARAVLERLLNDPGIVRALQ